MDLIAVKAWYLLHKLKLTTIKSTTSSLVRNILSFQILIEKSSIMSPALPWSTTLISTFLFLKTYSIASKLEVMQCSLRSSTYMGVTFMIAILSSWRLRDIGNLHLSTCLTGTINFLIIKENSHKGWSRYSLTRKLIMKSGWSRPRKHALQLLRRKKYTIRWKLRSDWRR